MIYTSEQYIVGIERKVNYEVRKNMKPVESSCCKDEKSVPMGTGSYLVLECRLARERCLMQ